jgi:hypothetical protein
VRGACSRFRSGSLLPSRATPPPEGQLLLVDESRVFGDFASCLGKAGASSTHSKEAGLRTECPCSFRTAGHRGRRTQKRGSRNRIAAWLKGLFTSCSRPVPALFLSSLLLLLWRQERNAWTPRPCPCLKECGRWIRRPITFLTRHCGECARNWRARFGDEGSTDRHGLGR